MENFNQEILLDIEIEQPLLDYEFAYGVFNSTHFKLYLPYAGVLAAKSSKWNLLIDEVFTIDESFAIIDSIKFIEGSKLVYLQFKD